MNPNLKSWNGKKCYPDLNSIPQKVDVVDVFRKGEAAPEIARQAAEMGAKALWLQEGVISEEAKGIAEKAGLLFVMDRCLMKEHKRVMNEARSC